MKKRQRAEDENQAAARITADTIAKSKTALPADLEAAWEQRSAGIQKVDARGMALLRAAFEAGPKRQKGIDLNYPPI
jgi:ABC-type transporter Mla MlaB component